MEPKGRSAHHLVPPPVHPSPRTFGIVGITLLSVGLGGSTELWAQAVIVLLSAILILVIPSPPNAERRSRRHPHLFFGTGVGRLPARPLGPGARLAPSSDGRFERSAGWLPHGSTLAHPSMVRAALLRSRLDVLPSHTGVEQCREIAGVAVTRGGRDFSRNGRHRVLPDRLSNSGLESGNQSRLVSQSQPIVGRTGVGRHHKLCDRVQVSPKKEKDLHFLDDRPWSSSAVR